MKQCGPNGHFPWRITGAFTNQIMVSTSTLILINSMSQSPASYFQLPAGQRFHTVLQCISKGRTVGLPTYPTMQWYPPSLLIIHLLSYRHPKGQPSNKSPADHQVLTSCTTQIFFRFSFIILVSSGSHLLSPGLLQQPPKLSLAFFTPVPFQTPANLILFFFQMQRLLYFISNTKVIVSC